VEEEQLLAAPFVAIHAVPIAGFIRHDKSRFVLITKLVMHPGAIEKAIEILKGRQPDKTSAFIILKPLDVEDTLFVWERTMNQYSDLGENIQALVIESTFTRYTEFSGFMTKQGIL
jgi:hypothetical protein